MKVLLMFTMILLLCAGIVSAQTDGCSKTDLLKTYAVSYVVPDKTLAKSTVRTDERRGCCSHHGGVCGCSDGRAMCCDGTLSPTCGCD